MAALRGEVGSRTLTLSLTLTLTLTHAALYTAMTLAAIGHLHERGWVHRDLKPVH